MEVVRRSLLHSGVHVHSKFRVTTAGNALQLSGFVRLITNIYMLGTNMFVMDQFLPRDIGPWP